MKETMLSLQELLQEAIRINDLQVNISAVFVSVKGEIVNLFKKIQGCEEIDKANEYFDNLQEIQDILSRLLFKHDFKMPKELITFVGECDRLDDIRLRVYLFNKIKNREYSFETLSVL